MTPIVNGLADEFGDQITIYQLNASEPANIQIQSEYGVRGHPSFIIIDGDGRAVQTFVGPQLEGTLREAMEAVVP